MRGAFSPVVCVLGFAATAALAQQANCPSPSSTYQLIQRGIFEQHDCTTSYCHGSSKAAGLDLRAARSYDNLLAEEQAEAPGEHDANDIKLVEPGDPENSLLWLLLAAKTLGRTGVPGTPMPAGGLPLSPDELEGIRLWIVAGAPERGFVGGVDNLIQPCGPPPTPVDESVPPPCGPSDRNLLLPDLVPDPPRNVRVISSGGHRVIQFDTGIANTGDGPLIVQAGSLPTASGQSVDAVQIIFRTDGSKCSRPAGAIFYDIDGRRWAYGSMADFELRADDPFTGKLLVRSSKSYFCLLDTDPIRASEDRPHQFEAHCRDEIGRMGISAGYKDVYNRTIPGQWIDIDADPTTTVERGTYYLVNIADPNQTLSEADQSREQNTSYTRVTIKLPVPETAANTPEAPAPHAARPAHPTRPTRAARPAHQPRSPHAPRPPHQPQHAARQ